jgi:hypothetical protein
MKYKLTCVMDSGSSVSICVDCEADAEAYLDTIDKAIRANEKRINTVKLNGSKPTILVAHKIVMAFIEMEA